MDEFSNGNDIFQKKATGSVQAVTQDLVFTAKVASFFPIDTSNLAREFGLWIKDKGTRKGFITYSTQVETCCNHDCNEGRDCPERK